MFVSVVGKKEAVVGQDFFPLTVNYRRWLPLCLVTINNKP
ncbi:polyribonucleotide nucleotidyltransferase [Vibrio cholerae]|nr:polyribonucleotide nucleotidyltransferase [Vibrio cholerae]